MDREPVEELLLLMLGIGTISYLFPSTITQKVIITIVLSVGLIMLLLLRSIDWRADGSNPYDWVLVLGVFLSLIHLFTFSAFLLTPLGILAIVLFAVFYILMAVLLYRHRWLFRVEE